MAERLEAADRKMEALVAGGFTKLVAHLVVSRRMRSMDFLEWIKHPFIKNLLKARELVRTDPKEAKRQARVLRKSIEEDDMEEWYRKYA